MPRPLAAGVDDTEISICPFVRFCVKARRRFHPLGDTELLTDDGVTQSARTDLNGNQLTGVKSYA